MKITCLLLFAELSNLSCDSKLPDETYTCDLYGTGVFFSYSHYSLFLPMYFDDCLVISHVSLQ